MLILTRWTIVIRPSITIVPVISSSVSIRIRVATSSISPPSASATWPPSASTSRRRVSIVVVVVAPWLLGLPIHDLSIDDG